MAKPRIEIVNAFVSAVVGVLRASVGERASLADLHVSRRLDPPPWIAVAIELRGSLRGPVTWVFSPELASLIAARLLMDDAAPTELVPEALAELSNIVAGNATGPLEDAGYRVEIAPPVVYTSAVRPELASDTLVATVTSDTGTVRVYMGAEVAA